MKTCGNCYNFFAEPTVILGDAIAGCEIDRYVVTGVDPVTGDATLSEVIATDAACEHWISEQAAKDAG